MSLTKQARVLKGSHTRLILKYLETRRNISRNKVIFLLSVKAGLRAKEIAHLRWDMLLNSAGEIDRKIRLTNSATKGVSGRVIPVNRDLSLALGNLLSEQQGKYRVLPITVVTTERSFKTTPQVIVNLFRGWYADLGLKGCSSHSGRRTFITNTARKISTVGGSIRDVQYLAGHKSLKTTERYIDYSPSAQIRVIDLV